MIDDLFSFAIAFGVVVSGPFAIRSTWRLFRLWRHDPRHSKLLLALWVVALLVTVVGAWVGLLLVRRLAGLEALSWSPIVTGVLTVAVLQIPAILDGLVGWIARHPDRPDTIGRGPS